MEFGKKDSHVALQNFRLFTKKQNTYWIFFISIILHPNPSIQSSLLKIMPHCSNEGPNTPEDPRFRAGWVCVALAHPCGVSTARSRAHEPRNSPGTI